MAGTTGIIPVGRRILMGGLDDDVVEFSGEAASLADMVFRFFEEGGGDGSPESSDKDDEEQNRDPNNVDESKAFWESQQQLLQATLTRRSSLESRIRNATKEALKESQLAGDICVCQKPSQVIGGCRNCLLRDVSDRLRNAGYNIAICNSKWRSSPNIPSGEHTYLDVVEKSSCKQKGEVRMVIELNFRAEFEMARASKEYNQLMNQLPEVFVGKVERLRILIKIMCSAAKKCMKENKMHMGPWRKHKYMEAKWLSKCERSTSAPLFPKVYSDRPPPKLRASMLTFDLLERLPSLHCTAVKVV